MPETKCALRCIQSARRRSIITAFVHCFLLLDLVDGAALFVVGLVRKEKAGGMFLKSALREPETRPRGEAHWLK